MCKRTGRNQIATKQRVLCACPNTHLAIHLETRRVKLLAAALRQTVIQKQVCIPLFLSRSIDSSVSLLSPHLQGSISSQHTFLSLLLSSSVNAILLLTFFFHTTPQYPDRHVRTGLCHWANITTQNKAGTIMTPSELQAWDKRHRVMMSVAGQTKSHVMGHYAGYCITHTT